MLKIKINNSLYNTKLNWKVDLNLKAGVAYHLKGENGLGKTSLIEELKLHWKELNPELRYAFTDQEELNGFQDLSVTGLMDVFWEVTQGRHSQSDWREIPLFVKSQKLWDKNIRQLSGGENQWVKILMMLSLDSEVWILDEPYQSLDAHKQGELTELLQHWIYQGKYLLVVHHGDLHLAPLITLGLVADTQVLRLEETHGH
ncbi:MAG: ATP-binding cassette domain-containing protein [Proteobacteria bacterium]|jgi:ABC-type Mn2+/Zn2+ transport system ATPase subunit|nr:ATP-binding cassette domain-containing protein [Pseudomonadota bacterium]